MPAQQQEMQSTASIYQSGTGALAHVTRSPLPYADSGNSLQNVTNLVQIVQPSHPSPSKKLCPFINLYKANIIYNQSY